MVRNDFPPEISRKKIAFGRRPVTQVEGLKSLESLGEGEAQRSDKKPQEMGGSEGIDPPFIIKYISIGFYW